MEHPAKELLCLLEYVRALENKDSPERGRQVQAALEAMGIEFTVQERRRPQIKNIIVDFSGGYNEKHLLFSAHYDTVEGSPGANDNASGVAVLLGLCRLLKNLQVPVKAVFFDREETWLRTPFLKLGLLGSLYYVWKSDLRMTSAVFNLEFCGQGDFLAIWSVKGKEENLPAVKAVEKAAAGLNLGCKSGYIPWLLFSSDHFSFRLRGFSNAITLSLLPSEQIPAFERLTSNLSLPGLLAGRKPAIPEILSTIHTAEDTASRLSESSLKTMLSLLMEIVWAYIPVCEAVPEASRAGVPSSAKTAPGYGSCYNGYEDRSDRQHPP